MDWGSIIAVHSVEYVYKRDKKTMHHSVCCKSIGMDGPHNCRVWHLASHKKILLL